MSVSLRIHPVLTWRIWEVRTPFGRYHHIGVARRFAWFQVRRVGRRVIRVVFAGLFLMLDYDTPPEVASEERE